MGTVHWRKHVLSVACRPVSHVPPAHAANETMRQVARPYNTELRLQDLEMLEMLGKGASSMVRRALHKPSGTPLAVKIVNVFDKVRDATSLLMRAWLPTGAPRSVCAWCTKLTCAFALLKLWALLVSRHHHITVHLAFLTASTMRRESATSSCASCARSTTR